MPPTSPRIYEAQNENWALTLLTSQRRLYSDAKTIYNIRMLVILVGAVAGIASGLLYAQHRVTIGIISGILLFSLSALGGAYEKRKAKEASSVQEELDTQLFLIPWNNMLAEHPTTTLISESSHRYKGESMRNWYSNTAEIVRPLDVLLCQRSNMGWGSSLHHKWRTWLISALVVLIFMLIVLAVFARMPFGDALASLVVPALPVAKEIIEQARSHADNARSKSSSESKILAIWREVQSTKREVTIDECRSIQDQILITRQTNSSIPDWFNKLNREKHEKAMIDSTDQLIEQAKRNSP